MAAMSDMMTPEQVARYLQVNKETVYRYIRERRLGAVRLGRHYRVPRENIVLFLRASQTTMGQTRKADANLLDRGARKQTTRDALAQMRILRAEVHRRLKDRALPPVADLIREAREDELL